MKKQTPTKSFIKTIFKRTIALASINIIIALCLFLLNSCKKNDYLNSNNAIESKKFINALKNNKAIVGSTSLAVKNINRNKSNYIAPINPSPTTNNEMIYLKFPTEPDQQTLNNFGNINSIQNLSDFIDNTNASIQYRPTIENSTYQIMVSIENIENSLRPLINQAKQYLYNKGFTDKDIQEMIVENNGKEIDLITFVMILSKIEQATMITQSFPSLLFNSAYAKIDANEYLHCAAVAIGADIVSSLNLSASSTWTIPIMKKAFGAAAKRMLGPVGVAIAVVSFGICLHEASLD